MTLSSTHYLAANAPYILFLLKYRPQLDVSLLTKDGLKILARWILSENLSQAEFGEFPHHPLEMNTASVLNDPTSSNPVYLNQVSVEARHLSHLCLSSD
jgi:hypothetical protein